ncbi:hypothetical protein KIF24_11120 [Micromonospora sp. Llam7]|uniref:hypothetical protein n=1 Tax=Micromonospora tarapacensis TaxID=2835305 RepID=UPI001C833F18|nr:hypothetical protein [Micromonospora tarapacensis]MBX7266531.1 hypothetical protein [Micromonospora tarapacensis]
MTTTSSTDTEAGRGTVADVARVRVAYADLVAALRARTDDAPIPAVLLAAHVKVLGMLAEERLCHVDLLLAAGERMPRRIEIELTDPTWRGLVDRVWRAAHAAATVAPDTGPADGADPLFIGPDAAGSPADPPARHGPRVEVRDGHLLLRAASGATSPARLDRLASLYRAVLTAMAAGPDDPAAPACRPNNGAHSSTTGPPAPASSGTVRAWWS